MFVNSIIHFMPGRTDKSILRTKDFNEKKKLVLKFTE